MAITEKSKPIEFTVDMSDHFDAGGELLSYDVIYETDPMKEIIYPLTINASGQNQILQCPVELLLEIVDYLTQKGHIQRKGVIPTPGTTVLNTGGGLPIPQVQKKTGGQAPIPAASQDSTPITSFDVTQPPETSVPSAPAPPPTPAPAGGGPTVVASNTANVITDEMKNRPVIRTKVKDPENDPTGAEREAAMIREQAQGGKKSNFKPAHRVEEE